MSNSPVGNIPLSKDSTPLQEGKPFDQLTEEERAVLVPRQIFDLKKGEPAFIFSRDNLRTIKRYASAVRQLPLPAEVEKMESLYVLGFKPGDINVFFDNLRRHVDSWDDVEDSCKSLGADLQVFAESLIKDGANFLTTVKALDSWDSSPEESFALEMLKLGDSETRTFRESVETFLQNMTEEISDKLENIRHVKKLIDRFGDAISKNLDPMGRSLFAKFQNHDAAETLQALEMELAQLDEAIQQKLVEYNGLVGASFYGLVFGPIGLAVTGGIYGAQAETVRAEKNLLLDRQAQLTAEKDVLLDGSVMQFESIKSALKDMQFRLVEVCTATKNLEDVWVLLGAYAKSSLKNVESVSTQLELKRFVNRFERVISPWGDILGITKKISELFNEALRG
ncbi:alpha-xenorhabdolysin family binary toxin subunit A [Pseudomonas sp. URMO17WK12:I11]|uniref:alpha-xenorhabdolysin family binary toxin subunit A n=1 Tax=Pseudomonas sp. URMO17WK12:I11 TaxID=1283291 RepID=UPI0011A19A8F|nr:alpha-xenorhabdolysin family binary toxin subunit A [Pseudomonas sp. URMO17WK12:I11]